MLVVCSTGYAIDGNGQNGSAVNQAFRLLFFSFDWMRREKGGVAKDAGTNGTLRCSSSEAFLLSWKT